MYEYRAEITKVYDGDGSFNATVDLGMTVKLFKSIRLFGIDTPEVRGSSKEAGYIVRDFVRSLILNKEVIIKTERDSTGKYGRLLATITTLDGINLNQTLLDLGYAKPYDGGSKSGVWSENDYTKIIKDYNDEH